MYAMNAKDDAKKEGLMELIKQMYAMMDKDGAPDPSAEHEALESPKEEMLEHLSGAEAMDEGEESERGGLMAKAMDKSEGSDDLDIDEIKDFLTKRRKSPVGKSVKIMAAIKTPAKKAKYK